MHPPPELHRHPERRHPVLPPGRHPFHPRHAPRPTLLHREHHQQVEGAGAVGVAALLAGKAPINGRKTGIIISGGNIDEEKLLSILEEYD